MPVLTVYLRDRVRDIPFTTGQSVRDILDSTDIRVRAGCKGIGACGLCRIRIKGGDVPRPTKKELAIIDQSSVADRVRLACQVKPRKNIHIEILNPAKRSNWRNLPEANDRRVRQNPILSREDFSPDRTAGYGIAVDLGTTHISISAYDLLSGKWLGGRIGQNPQANYGSDIMTRLVAASESTEQAEMLGRVAREAIGEALHDIAVRDVINLSQVVRFTLVGNTAMLALLSGKNYHLLTKPGYWAEYIDCMPENPGSWASEWGLDPSAEMEIIPPLAGFVGSDLLAGVLATRLTEYSDPSLFIDFGTNSEIALWDGNVLRVTSAAGGPAFEGSGLSCGMPAEPGAAYRVRFRNSTIDLSVITGDEARGLCGSGIIDLISGLVRRDILDDMGRFAPEYPDTDFLITDNDSRIVLTRKDIDLFQRAKAAIGTGIRILLAEADVEYQDLLHIYIGGAFGHFLDINNARKIGLLPGIPKDRIHLCGNTALEGCEMALLSRKAADQLKDIKRIAHTINLSRCNNFDEIFMENLYLRPLGKVKA